MPDNNPISNGMNTQDEIMGTILSEVRRQLDFQLGSITNQLQNIANSLKNNYPKQGSATGRSSIDITKETQSFIDGLRQLTESIEDERDEIKKDLRDKKGFSTVLEKSKSTILDDYYKKIKKLNDDTASQLNEQLLVLGDLELNLGRQVSESQQKLIEYEKLKERGKKTQQDVLQAQQEYEQLQKEYLSQQSKINKQISEINFKYDSESRQINRGKRDQERDINSRIKQLQDILGVAESSKQTLSELSSSYASFIGRVDKSQQKTTDEVLLEAIDKRTSAIDKLIELKEKQLKEETNLTKQEKDNIRSELSNLQAEKRMLSNMDPKVEETWNALKDFGKSMKDIAFNTLNKVLSGGLDIIKNRYFESYKEGFNDVYQSIETTRNSISARLALNQGSFDSLINDIQTDISSQGLEGMISSVDVNEAVVSLAQAGITDTKLLKTLAMEQAKLRASQSNIDLSNEETLGYILSAYRRGASGSDITSFIDKALASEYSVRRSGGDTALIGGGANTLLNKVLSIGSASGRSLGELSPDVFSAFSAAQSLTQSNISYDYAIQAIDDIIEKRASDLSTMGKIAYMDLGGREGVLSRSLGESILKYVESTSDVVSNMSTQFASEYLSAYDIGLTTKEALNLRRSDITGTIPTYDESSIQKTLGEINDSMKSSSWVSRTYEVTKKAENTMTDTAQYFQQFYEGNLVFQTGANTFESAVASFGNAILKMGGSVLKDTLTGGGVLSAGAIGAALQSKGPEALSSIKDMMYSKGLPFLTGGGIGGDVAPGLAAAGKALGSTVGIGIAGYNIIKDIRDSETAAGAFEKVATDSNVWMGVGTTLGSAIAGPIGGLLGGIVGKGSSAFGNWLGNKLSDTSDEDKAYQDFNKGIEELSIASDKLLQASLKQIDSITQQENTFSTFSTDQKKLYLLQNKGSELDKKNISEQSLNLMSEKETNELFNELVLTELEEKKEKLKMQAKGGDFLKNYARNVKDVSSDLLSISLSDNEAFDEAGRSTRERAITSRLTKEGASTLVSNVASSLGNLENVTRDDIYSKVDSILGSNVSVEEKGLYAEYIEGILSRKKQYDESNKEFHSRWDNARKQSGTNATIEAILLKYRELYPNGSGLEPYPNILTDSSGTPLVGDGGLPNLNDAGGMYHLNGFMNRFKTGLTSVPYDLYPALLHKGERVLTSREAEAYNELSSFAVSQLATNNNFSSYTSYGTNDGSYNILNSSINKQTTSLESILKQILDILKSLQLSNIMSTVSNQNSNVLRMNSNIVQVVTTK